MSSYDQTNGGGYLFCKTNESNIKMQVGRDQLTIKSGASLNSIVNKTTITVEVRTSPSKTYSVKDTAGYLNASGTWSNGTLPTNQQICLIYNGSMDFYGCRVWEFVDDEPVDKVKLEPTAYYDEVNDTMVMGVYDDVSGTGTFDDDNFQETSSTKDFASVTYMVDDEVYYSKAFLKGKVDTTLIEGPTLKGRIFQGWYDAPTGGNQVTALSSSQEGNKTLYGRYIDVMHNIIYKNGNEVIEVNGATQFAENDGLDLESIVPKVNPTGMKFIGWYDANEDGNRVLSIPAETENDVTLYAAFAYSEDAFIEEFLNAQLCDGGVTAPSKTLWQSLANEFANLGDVEKALFKSGNADANGTEIEQCLARYDYIIGKYGKDNYSDFMDRNPQPLFSSNKLDIYEEQEESTPVVITSVIAASGLMLSCLFVLKKKKHII